MDGQTQEWLRWALDGLGASAAVYARWTYGQLKGERTAREEAVKEINTRITAVELSAAAAARDSEVLGRVQEKLDKLAVVVYKMAGHMGIQTPE